MSPKSSLNPQTKSAPKRAKPISSDSPCRQKRFKGVRGLVRCEYRGGPKLKYDEYTDKSLFICNLEGYEPAYVSPSRPEGPCKPWDGCFDVRSINLRDLLTSERPEFRKVASLTDKDLAGQVGRGVFGSEIVFLGGMKPNSDPNRNIGRRFGPDISTESYAFNIHDPKQGIVKMAGDLNGGKAYPSGI